LEIITKQQGNKKIHKEENEECTLYIANTSGMAESRRVM
jgi:hypothetical protein